MQFPCSRFGQQVTFLSQRRNPSADAMVSFQKSNLNGFAQNEA